MYCDSISSNAGINISANTPYIRGVDWYGSRTNKSMFHWFNNFTAASRAQEGTRP